MSLLSDKPTRPCSTITWSPPQVTAAWVTAGIISTALVHLAVRIDRDLPGICRDAVVTALSSTSSQPTE